MSEVENSLPARLRTLLAERELSQAELARQAQIGRATLNKIINGKREPNARELGAIAHVLGVDLLELMGVATAIAERDELERRLHAAQTRAEQAQRDQEAQVDASSRIQACLAERIASLEAELDEAAKARGAQAAECAELREELARARERIELLEVMSARFPQRDPEPSERPWPTPVLVDDRYAPAFAKADLYGNIAGNATKLVTSTVVLTRALRRLNGKR